MDRIRQAYAAHWRIVAAYAEGRASLYELRASAKRLKHLKALHIVEREAQQVRST
jgi:hypothetical protein